MQLSFNLLHQNAYVTVGHVRSLGVVETGSRRSAVSIHCGVVERARQLDASPPLDSHSQTRRLSTWVGGAATL